MSHSPSTGIYQSQAGATDWKITSLHGDFVSSRKWYYWWGKWGGYRVDWNWRCYYSNRDAKLITRIGVANGIIDAIAAIVAAPVGAGLIVAGALTTWLWWEYSEACTRRRGVYINGYLRWYLSPLWRYQWGYGWITRISRA